MTGGSMTLSWPRTNQILKILDELVVDARVAAHGIADVEVVLGESSVPAVLPRLGGVGSSCDAPKQADWPTSWVGRRQKSIHPWLRLE